MHNGADEFEEIPSPDGILRQDSQASKLWKAKANWSSTVCLQPALETTSVLIMREVKNGFKGHIIVKNKTDQTYIFKILCNKSAKGMYESTPNIKCIAPSETVTLEITLKDPNYTNYFARGDKLIIRGYGLPSHEKLDPIKQEHFVTEMSKKWPRVDGGRYVVKVMVLEAGNVDILNSVRSQMPYKDLGQYLKQKRDFRGQKSEINGDDLNKVTRELEKLQMCKEMKNLQNSSTWITWARNLGFIGYALWYLFPVLYRYGAKDNEEATPLYVEPQLDEGSWSSLWNFFLSLIPAVGWSQEGKQ